MSSLRSNPPVPVPVPVPSTRVLRLSRFIEGEPLSGAELLQQPPASNEFLVNILSEMDEFEKKRKHSHSHSNSNSSVESLSSSNSSPTTEIPAIVGNVRKSFSFARSSLDEKERVWFPRPSLDERDRPQGHEKLSQKFRGRLRAWTGGREREEKVLPYPGV